MAGESSGEQHCQARGAEYLNPIKRSKYELLIRLVYPPYLPCPPDQMFQITERPAKKKDYTLKSGGKEYHGTTDDAGVLRQVLPPGVKSAHLTLYAVVKGEKRPFWDLDLLISDLDDCISILGIKARLNNLGLFACKELNLDLADTTDNYLAAQSEGNLQYVRVIERFTNLFGPCPDPKTAWNEKEHWERIKEVYGS